MSHIPFRLTDNRDGTHVPDTAFLIAWKLTKEFMPFQQKIYGFFDYEHSLFNFFFALALEDDFSSFAMFLPSLVHPDTDYYMYLKKRYPFIC